MSQTTPLFNRAAVYTDIHFGLRHNSREHNQDCIEFIQWLITESKTRSAETCIFMGDFHHHRSTINAETQNYMLDAMHLMNENFAQTFFIVGNHDLYYRENRTVSSSKFATLFPNITFIDEPTTIGDVSFIPWLVNDEWREIAKLTSRYIFGHFELPGFKMNAMVEMPDHGQLRADHFKHQEYIFSGHFHMRQTRGKVSYIGNPFGHNYADIWDFDRGAMFFEYGSAPDYVNYTAGPRFINIPLSSLLAAPETYLKPKTYLQAVLDLDISYEEAVFLRETFIEQYSVREFKLLRNQDEEVKDKVIDTTLKTVDQIVIEKLTNIESDSFDPKILIDIYNNI